MPLVHVFDNAVLQGLVYAPAVLGVTVAFRVLRYPDLTADGSFLLGAVVFSRLINDGEVHWSVAGAIAASIGALAGLVTALLHSKLRINRLSPGTHHYHRFLADGTSGDLDRQVFRVFTRWETQQQPVLI